MRKRISKEERIAQEEIFSTSYLTFDLIRKYCNDNKWYDAGIAINIYLFYSKCVSVQETKQVKASIRFVANWLWYNESTVSKYKELLEKIWCIEQMIKKENWKIKGRYIKVKFAIKNIELCGLTTSGFDQELEQTTQNTEWIKDKILNESKKNTENDFSSNSNEDAINKEKKTTPKKNIYPQDFEALRKLFPHARGVNKQDWLKARNETNPNVDQIVDEVKLLEIEIKYNIVDPTFIPATERWIRKYIYNEFMFKQRIKKIAKYMIDNAIEWKKEFIDMFYDYWAREIFQEIRKEESALFYNNIKNAIQ